MKWMWITLLCVLNSISSFELSTNNFPVSSYKNKGRHKNGRITNHPTDTIFDPSTQNEGFDSYFPDVIYPTSILDAAQPFYYSQPGYEDVLGPFSSDIKASYKTLTSGMGKITSDYSTSTKLKIDDESTIDIKNNTLLHCDYNETPSNVINLESQNIAPVSEATYTVSNGTMSNNYSVSREQDLNQEILEELKQNALNKIHTVVYNAVKDLQLKNLKDNILIPENSPHMDTDENISNEETLKTKIENNVCHANISRNNLINLDINENNDEVAIFDAKFGNRTYSINVTPNIVCPTYLISEQDDLDMLDVRTNWTYNNQDNVENLDLKSFYKTFFINGTSIPINDTNINNTGEEVESLELQNNNNTYIVNITPNYVITSETGNTHEDFVSDIMNIYSLIEETLRAITVVEFVVSKTLGSLAIEENQNETTSSNTCNNNETISFNELYLNNNITNYNNTDNIFSEESCNHSSNSSDIFLGENTSNLQPLELNEEDGENINPTDFNDNSYQSNSTFGPYQIESLSPCSDEYILIKEIY